MLKLSRAVRTRSRSAGPPSMWAVRLREAAGVDGLVVEELAVPEPGPGEALVGVHAAALTRDELTWPVDRLPAIPSYECSGEVVAVHSGVQHVFRGDAIYALTPFDRDGVASEFAAIPADLLAPKPRTLGHVECAATPLSALTAWQGLFEHGRLQPGQRVLVHGAGGGVGQFAVQLARRSGAHVIGAASSPTLHRLQGLGAQQIVDYTAGGFEQQVDPVDLVFDTVGGAVLARSPAVVRPGGRIVSVAEQAPAEMRAVYFVVQPNREQLTEIGRLIDAGDLRVSVDSVFGLADAKMAFARVAERGKQGKVVLKVADDHGAPEGVRP